MAAFAQNYFSKAVTIILIYFIFITSSRCYYFSPAQFQSSLAVLGIPLGDVLRILAAILLLGNVQFMDGNGLELDIQGENGM